jgi:hypothetical protein
MSVLTKIKLKQPLPYEEDCLRIQGIFATRDYEVSLYEARWLWRSYSDRFAASWLFLPVSDDEVFRALKDYFEDAE